MLSSERLFAVMDNQFSLVQHFKWSKSDIDDMIPFELDVTVEKLNKYLNTLEKNKKK